MRLHKYIASCGFTSRRRAELLIQAGRVAVNDRVETSLGTTIRPGKDRISVNGETISPPPARTIVFCKPAGCITSTHDTHERLTVVDLLPRSLRDAGVQPAGRLDLDTEGLLILTNDGDLAHRITHPSYETEKEYEAWVVGSPDEASLERLRKGIRLDDGMTSPAEVERLERAGGRSRVKVTIHEGRKRQVRRMLQAIGHEVVALRRVRIGGLLLGNLAPGGWRDLLPEELPLLTGGGAGKKAGPRRRGSSARREGRRDERSASEPED